MSNKHQIIFVDESGDLSLPKNDSLSYYTINAIYFNGDELNYYKKAANNIVKKHARGGELKSSTIGNNNERRSNILKEISEIGFPLYCLVIDKQRIYKDSGLQYKRISYKFLHRMFYERIKRSFYNISLISDPYGSTDFMESFIKYIQSKNNLFEQISFIHSQEEPLLQISDVIAGSIRRVYLEQDPLDNLKILGFPSIPIEEWPPNIRKFSEYSEIKNKFDYLIRQLSLNSAREFVEKNMNNSDEHIKSQAEVVRFLLIKFYENPTQYVHKSEIIEYLKLLNILYNERTILSYLRDNNVIICSTEKGVKLPYDSNDMHQWVLRASSQIVPYTKRINKVRTDFLIASQNEYDIVDSDTFPELSELLNKFKGS